MDKKEFRLAPVIACIITMLCVGIVYMWNVFQQPVMDYYGWEKTAVSFISAVNLFAFTAGIFLGGVIVDRKGPRIVNMISGVLFFVGLFLSSVLPKSAPWLIYITYGVLGGVGVGIPAVDALIVFALCIVVTAIFISLVHAVTARLKIEQLFKYYWTVVSGLALVSLVLAWYGL